EGGSSGLGQTVDGALRPTGILLNPIHLDQLSAQQPAQRLINAVPLGDVDDSVFVSFSDQSLHGIGVHWLFIKQLQHLHRQWGSAVSPWSHLWASILLVLEIAIIRHNVYSHSMTTHTRTALIIGGGIGGPLAATALARVGIEPIVY